MMYNKPGRHVVVIAALLQLDAAMQCLSEVQDQFFTYAKLVLQFDDGLHGRNIPAQHAAVDS